jgi:hypothetical protein
MENTNEATAAFDEELPMLKLSICGVLTTRGFVITKTPQPFWQTLRRFFESTGYSESIGEVNDIASQLKMFTTFSETWKFKKFLSYLHLTEFNSVTLLDTEKRQGQYHCNIDVLYEGDQNKETRTASAIIRVPIVIVAPVYSIDYNSRIKFDILNKPQLLKSPITLLIEQNFRPKT